MRSAIGSVFDVLRRDAAEIAEQPLAVGSGFAGLLLTMLAVWGVGSIARADVAPSVEAIEIPFVPGTLARLGTRPDAPEAGGASRPTEAPPAASASSSTPETVTTNAEAPPVSARTHERRSTPPESRGSKLPGPPIVDTKGDPFGDPHGWDELTRDGDAWATSVVEELSQLEVGWYGGKVEDGEFRFQISVCPDGDITDVRTKGGDLSHDGQGKVRLALEQLQLPRPPKHVRDRMAGGCAKIQHVFVWTPNGVH